MMPDAVPTSETATLAQLQAWGHAQLSGAEARRESEMLLVHALQRDRAWLFAHARDPVEPELRTRFASLVAERSRGVPVAYLLGQWGFWNLDLQVTPATLIPRPETECLVEAALQRLDPTRVLRVADLGTGSGAIALALARERPLAQVVATDASPDALAVARANARRNGLERIEFRLGDWLAPLGDETFDLIASNPPYVADEDPHVGEGDLRFEPRLALTSGPDGLDAIRRIAGGAPARLHPGGHVLLEHGYGQGEAVRTILADAGFTGIATLPDLEGRERVSLGTRAR
jgi:release factor glutamine methyltransferase